MSEEAPGDAQSSVDAAAATVGAPQGRSIFSYFGNGSSTAGPSRPPPAAPPAKKRRKKEEDAASQARLKANGGGGWTLGKHGEVVDTAGEATSEEMPLEGLKKPKAKASKARDDGEEAEAREMKKKMREAAAMEKVMERKGKRKSKEVLDQEGNIVTPDPSTVPAVAPRTKVRRKKDAETLASPAPATQSSSTSSPMKRPRNRRPKTTAAQSSQSQSQDPPEPIDLSQQPSSDPPDPVGEASPAILLHRASSTSDIVITGHLKSGKPDKPGHPFFSRTNSAISTSTRGASQQDPIDIDVDVPPASLDAAPTASAKLPKKTIFASDAKPAHSFFSRVANGDTNGTRGSSVLSEAAPTEASVATNRSTKEKGKGKVHGFFKANGQAPPHGVTREGWGGGLKNGEGWLAPWPGREWPTHTSGPPASAIEPSLLPRRNPVPVATTDHGDFWTAKNIELFRSDLPNSAPSPPPPPPIHASPAIDKHPAIASLPSRGPSDAREMWIEHHRPRRACEVLGNEIEATYLRDWLSALAVGSKDGTYPKVVRKIKKIPYKPQSFDGWLVDDIGLFGDVAEEEEDEAQDFVEIEEAPLPFHRRPAAYPDFKGRLANAILLIGPPGTGKSAAIHAVTAELGWGVFEVYPGIGKRTAANLFSLVGDVGRNHMVVKSKDEPRGKADGKGFFGAMRTSPRKPKHNGLGSQEQPIDLDDHAEGEVVSEESKFRQSVILLDEVDLLFDEENSFWAAVRQLIAESKRPVILTCNETIPLATLPLQAILDFRPPPRSLTAAYLSAVAKQENVVELDVAGLVAQSMSCGPLLVDQPLPPNGHEPMPTLDLRRAITQLQLDRGARSSCTSASATAMLNLDVSRRQLEVRSSADAMIAPRAWASMDEHEIDRLAPGADDLLDVHLLCKSELPDSNIAIPAYDLSRHMSTYLQYLSGGLLAAEESLPAQCVVPLPAWSSLTSRTQYIRSLLPVLDPLIPLSAHLLPHTSLFLDHLSAIRSMVRGDDMMEEAEEASLADGGDRVNRKTGRPVRAAAGREGGFQRYLYQLNRGACDTALASELVFT